MQLSVETVIVRAEGISPEALQSYARGPRSVISARHLAIYLAHQAGGLSLADAGAAFERDRRSAGYALARIEARRESDPSFDRAVDLCGGLVSHALKHAEAHALMTPFHSPG